MRNLILLLALCTLPQWCRAAESCLWLNEATAAGILGGSVAAQISHMPHEMSANGTANAKSSAGPMNANASAPNYSGVNADDEDCSYVRHIGAISSEIRIEVRTMYQLQTELTSRQATCGSDKVALRAIGNEAVACNAVSAAKDKSQQTSEQVVGRVRDRAFLVRISSTAPATDRMALREDAKTAAEIVAGNLF